MFCPLIASLFAVLLSCSFKLSELVVSSPELTVHVGDSALLGCVFQNTEEKSLTKVDWLFSAGEHAKSEFVLFYYSNLSVAVGRFENRVHLVGDLLHSDGSLLLENVQEGDQGSFTCEVRMKGESKVLKTEVQVQVLPEEPKEFQIYVGDSVHMGCVFRSTEEKQMTEMRWTFSPGQGAKEEVILHYHHKFSKLVGYPQRQGHFQNHIILVGDIFNNDGSIMLHKVKASDQGNYTCSICLGNVVFRKTMTLHVIQEEPRSTEGLDRNQLVIIVGIVCTTLLLLSALILLWWRIPRNKSSGNAIALGKNQEATKTEKHIYSSLSPWDACEEEPSAVYMIMNPVCPTYSSEPSHPPERKSAERTLRTEPTF